MNVEEKKRYMKGRISLGRTDVPENMVESAVFLTGVVELTCGESIVS